MKADPVAVDRREGLRVRLTRLLDEVTVTGPIPPRVRRDWALAVFAMIVVVIEVVIDAIDAEPPLGLAILRLGVGFGTAAFVPFRRQAPLTGVVVALALDLVLETVGRLAGGGGQATIGQIIAGILLMYALCRWDRPGRVFVGTTLLVVSLVAAEYLIEGGNNSIDFVVSWVMIGVFALAMRYRWVMVDQRDRRVRIAERHALARDVHDSVAHHVSAIAVQAQAARYVAATDPDSAVEAMARVEATAGQTVDELRRLVGVLRTVEESGGIPSSASMLDLADPSSQPPVVVRGDHDLTGLPNSVATGAYRIAQEAVTNARRHSRQATMIEVLVRRTDRQLALEVTDDGALQGQAATGYGLTGMGERAEVLGGWVTFGSLPKHGWRVSAVLPIP